MDSHHPSLSSIPTNETYRKVKGWYNLFLQHKYINPEAVATFNHNRTPTFYRIFIDEVKNIHTNMPQSDHARLYLKLNMTFFNKHRRKFYGRTYTSHPILLVSQGGQYQLADPLNIYFYSTIETGEDNILIVEAHILEITNSGVLTKDQPLGWCWMEVYSSQSLNLRPATFCAGTPRMLLDQGLRNDMGTISTTLSFKVLKLDNFGPVMSLLDEAILCGSDDILPGLVGKALPNSAREELETPILEPTARIYFEDLVVDVPPTLEADIIRSAQHYRTTQFGLTPEAERSLTDVHISERKFTVAFHNSWTAVNSRKFKNSVTLHRNPADRGRTSFVFSGALDCDGVFSDEHSILIFELDYEVTVPKPDGTKTTWKITVGWAPYLLPNLAGHEVSIKEYLIRGPGRSPTSQKLYEPSHNIPEAINVSCKISSNKAIRGAGGAGAVDSRADLSIYQPPRHGRNPSHPGHPGHPTRDESEELAQLKMLLNQKQDVLLKTQHELELARRQAEEYRNSPVRQRPDDPHYPPYPPKDNPPSFGGLGPYEGGSGHYHKELADQYVAEAERTRKEMQNVKDLIIEMQNRQSKQQPEYGGRYETGRLDYGALGKAENYMADLSPTKPVADFGPTQQLSPQPYTREISRADKALLVQSGIKGILDNVGDYGVGDMDENKAMHVESKDSYKASVFLIQFLALKASQQAVFRESLKPLDLNPENYELPAKVHFTYNFFDTPATKTETIALERPKDMPHDPSSLKYGTPYYLVRDAYLKTGTDAKEPVLRYEIDPSVNQQYNRHIEFAKYLYSKSLTIDIWDADSLMLFGSVKVPLRELLRQGKQVSTFSKEFDIIEPGFMRSKGSLQILLKNVGKQPVNEMPKPKVGATQKMMGKPGFEATKKKVKSKQKINLPEEFKAGTIPITRFDEHEEMSLDPEQRKQERINRYKMATIEVNTNVMMTSEEFQKEKHRRELREIDNFRDVKKATTLKAALNQQFKEEKVVNVKFGKVEIIPLEVTNYYNYDVAFTVNISDPDELATGKAELSVVSNPAEWKYWCESQGFANPPEWNMIAINSNSFVLKSGERVEILLKYLTLRNYSVEYQRDYTNGRVLKDDNRRRDFVATRVINVSVGETNGRIATGTKLEIVPCSPIVDHIFRFFEPENRNVKLYLPALYHNSLPPAHRPILVMNYSKAAVEWLNDKEITMQLKVPSSQKVLRFNLLAYNDIYYTELLGNWVIEIHACTGVDINVNIGQLTTTKLTLPGETARMVRCYVSHPSMAFFPHPYDRPFALTPATMNSVSVNVRSFNVKNQTVLVNCVDVATKELVYSWIVRLMGTEPHVSRKYELSVRCGVDSNQKFIYENRSAGFCIFEFVSSHPDILQPVEKNVPIEGGQKENIRIRIAGRDQPGIAEVCLYASDTEEKIFECLLFQIKFVY